MRVLLDTNIVIHREASKAGNQDIGMVFKWLDKIGASKCIHPITVMELARFNDANAVKVMNIKIGSYHQLKTIAAFEGAIKELSDLVDRNQNDVDDSKILNEVYTGRVDILISEDRKIHRKAIRLNIPKRFLR
ncbi:hypothetical protein B0I27_11740 [Arcticibacter pallidicorallinus]|uniref:PIN domain-containing protein n=1 Tax=Arcticibacter pallidicorallinus TaxID=1259464 RepID=A0A2T0TQP5_9SPHI|nr:PIN domain-containing protein [Arcticibacter pallidicorallinus]PRY48052.1 hypothetical protein B0I27_11740 [Arcticibacter pallidicorallinus]